MWEKTANIAIVPFMVQTYLKKTAAYKATKASIMIYRGTFDTTMVLFKSDLSIIIKNRTPITLLTI